MASDTTFLHRAAGFLSPEYNKVLGIIRKEAAIEMVKGIVATIAAVALAILGIALCAVAQPWGVLPLLASLPLFYYGYNTLAMVSNLAKLSNDPFKELKIQDWVKIDEAWKAQVLKNTFCFEWSANLVAQRISKKFLTA